MQSGTYQPLLAPPTVIIRSRQQQQPDATGAPLLQLVYEHFKDRPCDFEQLAANLWQISQPNVDRIDVTRPWRNGGRDAVGDYLLGPRLDPIAVEFALEAKCYGPGNSVGVRETGRLISRLRYRQFGVLVTTSYVHSQGYQEIREDGHPSSSSPGETSPRSSRAKARTPSRPSSRTSNRNIHKALSTDAPTAAEAVDGAIRLKRDMRVRGGDL